jgi:hypothetical protein
MNANAACIPKAVAPAVFYSSNPLPLSSTSRWRIFLTLLIYYFNSAFILYNKSQALTRASSGNNPLAHLPQ